MTNFFRQVILNDARFGLSERVSDLELLEPITREKVRAIIAAARDQGLELRVFETFRSKARQQLLFERGATKLKDVGVHHYGLACDIVKVVGGKSSWEGDFGVLGELAREQGLIWGGDWGEPNKKHTFVDGVHVQRCAVARQKELFGGNWYPNDDYDPFSET
jgi:hypothetical protein